MATTPHRPSPRFVMFYFDAPAADRVALVGDFNAWNPQATPLRRRKKDGRWWARVSLLPGEYQYKFVVDGSVWHADPQNPHRVSNPHGSFNSVCIVRDV